MKDTETVKLDDRQAELRKIIRDSMFASEKWDGDEQFGYYTGRGPDEHFVPIDGNWLEAALNDTEAAIIKLFEQAVESAKPEALVDILQDGEYYPFGAGYNSGIKDFEQNLLQALSNSGEAERNRLKNS